MCFQLSFFCKLWSNSISVAIHYYTIFANVDKILTNLGKSGADVIVIRKNNLTLPFVKTNLLYKNLKPFKAILLFFLTKLLYYLITVIC